MRNSKTRDLESLFDAKQKMWSGESVTPLFDKDVSIGKVALFVLGINPNKVVQICDTTGERLTCENLAQLGIRVAHNLIYKLGLQQEDVVGIMANNTTYITPIVLGAFMAGTPVNPLHHTMDRKTVKHVFGLTKPKVIFCDVESYNELMLGLDDIGLSAKVYTLRGHIKGVSNVQELLHEIESEKDFSPVVLKKGGDQNAAILCTSGSTGVPKEVCISHQNFLNRNDLSFVTASDVLFTFSTLYWVTGLIMIMSTLITGAMRVITDRPFTPEFFIELIEKHKITQIIVPPAYALSSIKCPDIFRRDLSSIRTFMCGGAPVSASISETLKKYLKKDVFSEAYGLSELGGISNLNRLVPKKKGSVGRLTSNIRAKIFSEDGKPLGIGETGELHLSSPYKWSGYYGNPVMTRLAVDSDGWIKTGDLAYFDEDGFLFICGREKDLLRYRHLLVAPIEIEQVIHEIPGVVEVCVFGIPDQMEEDLPTAAIIKSPECTLTREDVCKVVANCLPEEKHLRGGVYFLQELPKTPSGKIERHKLLSIVEELKLSEKLLFKTK